MGTLAISAAALKLPLAPETAARLCLALERGEIVRLGPCRCPSPNRISFFAHAAQIQ